MARFEWVTSTRSRAQFSGLRESSVSWHVHEGTNVKIQKHWRMSGVPPFGGDNRPVPLGRNHDKAPVWRAGPLWQEDSGALALRQGGLSLQVVSVAGYGSRSSTLSG